MTALGWTLFFVLYAIGYAYFAVADFNGWRKQGIPFQWSMIFDKHKAAWPIAMLSDTIEKLR